MKKLFVPILTALGTLLPASGAGANWFSHDNSFRAQWDALYPSYPIMLNQTYTTYKPEWRQVTVDMVVQRWNRKEVVEKIKVYVLVPKWEGHVCHWVPEERTAERRRMEWYATPETVTTVQTYCVMVPYTSEASLPALLPHYGPPVNPFHW